MKAVPAKLLNPGDSILFQDRDGQWRKGTALYQRAGRVRVKAFDGREFSKVRFEVRPDRDSELTDLPGHE